MLKRNSNFMSNKLIHFVAVNLAKNIALYTSRSVLDSLAASKNVRLELWRYLVLHPCILISIFRGPPVPNKVPHDISDFFVT